MTMATEQTERPGRPVSKRREATRERLRAAAIEAFAERGFHGTSVEDLCERAGFTRGAFYSNYASREELVLDLYERQGAAINARLAEIGATADLEPRELLRQVMAVWGEEEAGAERRRAFNLLLGEFTLHAIRDPEAGAAWRAVQGRLRADTARLLQDYLRVRGLTVPVSSDDLARLLHVVVQGSTTQHLLDPQAGSAESLAESFVALLLQAARPTSAVGA